MLSPQRVQSRVREIKSRKTEQPRRKETTVTATAFCPLQLPAKSLAMMDARMNVLTRHLETQPYPVLDSGAVSGKHQETARSTGCPGCCMQRCFTSRRAPRKQERPDSSGRPAGAWRPKFCPVSRFTSDDSGFASCRAPF